jgi:hypothetical protein
MARAAGIAKRPSVILPRTGPTKTATTDRCISS